MRRTLLGISCLLGACAALAPAPEASAAKRPSVKLVAPMRAEVGGTLVIRGRGFSGRRSRNTVVFRGPKGRSTLAKPRRASRRKLVLVVPISIQRVLETKDGKPVPTRFRLRVITRRRSALTGRNQSPVIVPRGGLSASCGSGGDWDGDLLSNSLEARHALDPCRKDSDGDGLEDGWEYWSAKDLNVRAVPYPGKRLHPNALDGTDAKQDFDGDTLIMREEFTAWVASGRSFDPARPDRESPLGYSDGTQTSRPRELPKVPAWQSPNYGIPFSPPAYPARLDLDQDGEWSDEERDADADGMTNFHEAHGPGTAAWWAAILASERVEPWPKSYYGAFTRRPLADLNLADPDVDGDTLLDGEDDQDNDGWTNISEMYSRTAMVGLEVRNTNAFNPCAPQSSRTCPRDPPIG